GHLRTDGQQRANQGSDRPARECRRNSPRGVESGYDYAAPRRMAQGAQRHHDDRRGLASDGGGYQLAATAESRLLTVINAMTKSQPAHASPRWGEAAISRQRDCG